MAADGRFAVVRRSRRIWAVASIHGELEHLARLHDRLAARLEAGDRIVYLGNYLGRGPAIGAAVDALIAFRCWAIARPGVFAADVVHLRGAQEHMLQKLLQLQLAHNPREVYSWMLAHGVGPTVAAYGFDPQQAYSVARAGAVALARWTGKLRAAVKSRPGHDELLASLRRAAFTEDGGLLFVHAGIDPDRPLAEQGDSLWWATPAFDRLLHPFEGFRRVVRGFDPLHRGLLELPHALSVDGGCGFGGRLIAACLDPAGNVVDVIEA
jgi:serine/threonine protein phosphatase 1